MASKKNPTYAYIAEKLDALSKDMKELREKDIPNIKMDIEIIRVKSAIHARLVSAIGGIIAVAVSAAIAFVG